jgi:hypothetical protein
MVRSIPAKHGLMKECVVSMILLYFMDIWLGKSINHLLLRDKPLMVMAIINSNKSKKINHSKDLIRLIKKKNPKMIRKKNKRLV